MLAWFAWLESGERKYLAAFYFFLALAMLAKGPVAPFLATVVTTIFAASQKSFQALKKTLWMPGLAIFCLVALPWYAAVQLRNPQFFRVFILEHNLARFGTNLYHHPEPFWYYVPVALLSWVPWVLFVVAAGSWAIRKMRESGADALNTFLLIWVVTVVVFFSISTSKLPGYILPGIPPGMLVLANYLSERFQAKPHALLVILHAG